ncbi:MAG TPA: phosphopantetheine-binding protein [Thermoanaerobaculia bacterium]|nr:phosphopantetheine-binding protein [Thermoanaerobaculia bacterium]
MNVEAVLREILRNRGVRSQSIDAATPLGGDGLGLDSIAIAEVLLDCEARFGVNVADLLSGETITFGALVERLEQR